jgi:hypothetical protein
MNDEASVKADWRLIVITFQLLDLTKKEPRNRVGWFFRREEEKIGVLPMLFDFNRWGQCDEAIVAEENGEIIGVITISLAGLGKSERPTLDTLYVIKSKRMNGSGYELFVHGLRRLIDRGATGKIFCDLQSRRMLSLIDRLPIELRDRLLIRHSYQLGDLADDFESIEQ